MFITIWFYTSKETKISNYRKGMNAVFKGAYRQWMVSMTNIKDACQGDTVVSTSWVREAAVKNHTHLVFVVFSFWTGKKNNKVVFML